MSWLKNAFKVDKADAFTTTEHEQELLDKVAERICRHGMAVPGILFLETFRPLNFIGSQSMAFFEPIVRSLFDWESYTVFWKMLERRGSVEALIRAIEKHEAERSEKIAALKKEQKEAKRARKKARQQDKTGDKNR
ncbi:MAG: hypothetical protein P9L99_15515 [Candidatus Lernaella stagnicola]|nr:hypothetical protein [Candidatus Lernaella stagnicola]